MSENVAQCQQHPDAPSSEDYGAGGGQTFSECGPAVGDRATDVDAVRMTFSDDVGGAENPPLDGSGLSAPVVGPSGGDASSSGGTNHKNKGSAIRFLLGAYEEIGVMAGRLNLQRKVVDRANELFKRLHDCKVLKGRSRDVIAPASLYVACRQEGVPRTLKEVSAVSKVNKLGKGVRQVLKFLDRNVDPITTGDFVSRFCCNLGLPDTVQRAAAHVAEMAVELDLVGGRSPISVAAAAIFMVSQASEEKRTQKQIINVVGVSESTIKLVYKLMLANATSLFPEDFEFDTQISKLPKS